MSIVSETHAKINIWAKQRNLIEGSTPTAQMVKLMEEVGELAHAIARGRSVTDAIGDCAVVLSVLALQHQTSLATCMDHAYQQIKDRRGVMMNGVFVKQEDSDLMQHELLGYESGDLVNRAGGVL